MKQPSYLDMPKNIHVRYAHDGTFFIARPNRAAEEVLDKLGIRVKNELRWYPRVPDCKQLSDLAPLFEERVCYIVGKGPSLDNLTAEYFDDGPIITLNESIHHVEALDLDNPLVALQQDVGLKRACWTEKGKMLVPNYTAHLYHNHPELYVFAHNQLVLTRTISVCVAIAVLALSKAKSIKLLCFDAYTHRDTDYANCIGHPSSKGGVPNRFLQQSRKITEQLDGLDYEFITPKDLP